MKKILGLILVASMISLEALSKNCCQCFDQYEQNSHAIDVLAVSGVADCLNTTVPFGAHDAVFLGYDIYKSADGVIIMLEMSVEIFTWGYNFSNCAQNVVYQSNQIQWGLIGDYQDCMINNGCFNFAVNC